MGDLPKGIIVWNVSGCWLLYDAAGASHRVDLGKSATLHEIVGACWRRGVSLSAIRSEWPSAVTIKQVPETLRAKARFGNGRTE